jgi:putative transposase
LETSARSAALRDPRLALLEPERSVGHALTMDPLPPSLAFFLLLVSGWVILDRDPLYTAAFRRLLRGSGVKPLVVPAWSPNLNAFAERFVESAKSECLERLVPLGEGHLRAAVRAFVQHFHEERPHQGLGNELIAPKTTSIGSGPVTCRARLGGVLKFYDREAA